MIHLPLMTSLTNEGLRIDARIKRIVAEVNPRLKVKDPFNPFDPDLGDYRIVRRKKELASFNIDWRDKVQYVNLGKRFKRTAEDIFEKYQSDEGKTRLTLTSFSNPAELYTPYGSLKVLPEVIKGYDLKQGKSLQCILEQEKRMFYVSSNQFQEEELDEFFKFETSCKSQPQHALNTFLDGVIKSYTYLKETPDDEILSNFGREETQQRMKGLIEKIRDLLVAVD